MRCLVGPRLSSCHATSCWHVPLFDHFDPAVVSITTDAPVLSCPFDSNLASRPFVWAEEAAMLFGAWRPLGCIRHISSLLCTTEAHAVYSTCPSRVLVLEHSIGRQWQVGTWNCRSTFRLASFVTPPTLQLSPACNTCTEADARTQHLFTSIHPPTDPVPRHPSPRSKGNSSIPISLLPKHSPSHTRNIQHTAYRIPTYFPITPHHKASTSLHPPLLYANT